jgi:hypothetical protein
VQNQVLRRWTACTLLAFLLLPVGLASAAAKKYQVTGKVLQVDDKMIVVQKDDEKWEIERTAATKVDGELKVGSKVTIYYHMVADSAETKSAGDAKDAKK